MNEWLGGGEMGALIRSTDWSKTRLGPSEQWPLSLKTMLGVVLGSRFPMLLWWGPELLHLYNDAYRPILRDKHPASLGAPAAEVWAEVWDVAGPLARGVQAGGPATWTEDLQLFINAGGLAEETYFTFSYSPVPGDDGRVGGVLNTVQETTAKVQGERQIRLLHELSSCGAQVSTEAEAHRAVLEVLATDALDLPFAFLFEGESLVGATGWGGPRDPAWPVAEVLRSGEERLLEGLGSRFGPLPEGRWGGRPERALLLPLTRPGHGAPFGVLVAGLSPHRTLDERYRLFLRAIAARLVSALGVARAHEGERRRAEAQGELARQRAEFERFFSLSLDMMCIAGLDGYFKRLSPAFETLGYRDGELLGRPFIEFVHPDDVQATLAEMSKLGSNVPTLSFENRYRCQDGSYRWLAWTSAPDNAGSVYAVARDITQTKRTLAELAAAKEAADAANRELESFSYSVAHDLRAPLRSLDGFSQALLEDYRDKLDVEGQTHLRFVRESAQQMAALIDDLLALSRVTLSELHREPVDLSGLAQAVLTRLQRQHPERRVELLIEDGLACTGDRRLLTVALDNLLANAWKFTGKRDAACIEFGATLREGHPTYFVRDNGAGFDMNFSGKLFGVFQRLHAAAEFEGTGIGLATVRRVVGRHGGRVWGEGAVGKGATFFFTLSEREKS